MTAVMLAVTVMCGTVMGSYQEAQATEIVAGYGLAEILTSFFMSVGLTVGVKDLVDNGDLQKKLDEWMKSDYERIYEKYMQSYPNLPDQTPSPIPSPEITQTPTEDTDKQLPATYEQLKEQAATDGILEMVPATFFCLATVVQDLWDNFYGEVSSSSLESSVPSSVVDTIIDSGNPYYYYCYRKGWGCFITTFGIGSYRYSRDQVCATSYVRYEAEIDSKNQPSSDFVKKGSGGNSNHNFSVTFVASNVPLFSSDSEGKAWQADQLNNTDIYKKENYWPSTDLKANYDNNTSPDLPSIAVPPVIRVPTLDEIKELLQQGNDDEENRPTYVTNFITNHTVQPTPDPDPTQAPDANPTPTVAVAPVPGGKDDPETSPSPSTTPAVVPDPDGGTDPQPSVSPDQGSGGDGDTDTDNPEDPTPEEEASPYKTDLREIFPFCIPFDLIHLLKVFEADAEAPVFEFPLDIEMDNPWTGEKVVDYHHTFKLDMSDYEDVIKILRIFQVIFFIIALMLITRQQMIKG